MIMYVVARIPVAISNIVVAFGDPDSIPDEEVPDEGEPPADQGSDEMPDEEKYAIANPESPTNGTNSVVSVVADTELGRNVAELQVLESDNYVQGYVGFPLGQEDFTVASKFEFKVLVNRAPIRFGLPWLIVLAPNGVHGVVTQAKQYSTHGPPLSLISVPRQALSI